MIQKDELKIKAELLRRKGWLYADISSELGVAKSTIHGWLKGLELTALEQMLTNQSLQKLRLEAVNRLKIARDNKRNDRDYKMRQDAKNIVNLIDLTQSYKQLLCAIMFWCEGAKDTTNGMRFINSDPVMIRSFLLLFRNSFSVDESKFRAIIHLHDYHDPADQLKFWSNVTSIPENQFYKPYIKPHTGKRKRAGYPGCISVRYADRNLGKLLQMLYTEFGSKT